MEFRQWRISVLRIILSEFILFQNILTHIFGESIKRLASSYKYIISLAFYRSINLGYNLSAQKINAGYGSMKHWKILCSYYLMNLDNLTFYVRMRQSELFQAFFLRFINSKRKCVFPLKINRFLFTYYNLPLLGIKIKYIRVPCSRPG